MFTTVEDFSTGEFQIPGLYDLENEFENFIEEKEEEALQKIFGPLFYTELTDGLLLDPIPDKWLRLRDGYTFLHDSIRYKWRGLKWILIPYIYSEWLDRRQKQLSVSGTTVVPETENAETVSSADMSWRAWNKFKERLGIDTEYYGTVDHTLFGYINYGNLSPDLFYTNYHFDYDFGSKNPWNI